MSLKGKKYLYTEVADDEMSKATGLMYRKHLGSSQGMLFCFSSEDYYPFWMKNTYVPLDIAFINNEGKIVDIRSMTPLSTRRVSSRIPFSYALETNQGWFKENSITIGHMLWSDLKTSAAEQPALVIAQDFKTAVNEAEKNHWNLAVTYQFNPFVYREGKQVERDSGKPLMNQYQFILDGVTRLPSGKSFEYMDSGNGEYIIVPCVHSSGEPRCFFVDGILAYKYSLNGRTFIDPREIQVVQRKQKRLPKPETNQALQGIQSIPF